MFCVSCGSQIPDGSVNCPNCGAAQNAQQPMYQQPQQPMYQQPQQPMYQQPMYQQPMYQQAPPVPGKGLGIASMVIGIVSLVIGICLGWIGIVTSVVGLVLGGIAISKAKSVNGKNGMAVAGLVCNIISLAFDTIWIIAIAEAALLF